MKALAILPATIMKILYAMEPMNPHVGAYGEISEAIAAASNQNPLFPDREDGSARTASLLVSVAWFETKFHPNLLGDGGKSFGMYQIQPRTAESLGRPIMTNQLLSPREASFIAIDLFRVSMTQCQARPWEERLTWYVASNGCPSHPILVRKSMDRMLLADRLFRDHFPQFLSLPSPTFAALKPKA